MQISLDNFKSMFQPSLWGAKLFMLKRAHVVVLQQYCNKLTVRSACTGDCKVCGLHIKGALDWMTEAPDLPKLSYGVFGKVMKTAFANRIEEVAKRPAFVPETNNLGEATERDPFDIFEEALNG